jgi:hypothetical protein
MKHSTRAPYNLDFETAYHGWAGSWFLQTSLLLVGRERIGQFANLWGSPAGRAVRIPHTGALFFYYYIFFFFTFLMALFFFFFLIPDTHGAG